MKKQNVWLSHLKGSIPQDVFGYPISMYCVALEGWRRGMTLKFINNNRRKSEIDYSLTYKGREHSFLVSMGDSVTEEAIKICKDKHLTKRYLSEAGVSIPKGESFGKETTDEQLISYANNLGYPLVLKPSKGTGGRGVIANIKNEKEFREALTYVKYDLKYSELIIETFFDGRDYRVYVLQDKVLAVLDRIPANVIGDGKNSVKSLLKLKNQEREKNPALSNRSIKIDKEMHNMLRSKGYTLDSIPESGEQLFLKSKNNISAGGDSVDMTEALPEEIKSIAVNAVKAIPGMTHGGVDIMVNQENNTGVVIEVNSRPGILSHMFPMVGTARDIPKAIIDYYFPETKSNYTQPSYYFDFKHMFQSFQSGAAKEFIVPDMPSGKLTATRFEISGTLRNVSYEKWVQKQARDLKLNGFVKHLRSGKLSVVVSGSATSIKKFRDVVKNKSSKRARVTNVVEKDRKSPVKIGFEIIDSKTALEMNSKGNSRTANKVEKIGNSGTEETSNLEGLNSGELNQKFGYNPVRLKGILSKKFR